MIVLGNMHGVTATQRAITAHESSWLTADLQETEFQTDKTLNFISVEKYVWLVLKLTFVNKNTGFLSTEVVMA